MENPHLFILKTSNSAEKKQCLLKGRTLSLVFFFLLLGFGSALAQTSWTGTRSADWNRAANWTNGVPAADVDAIIGDLNFTGSNHPTISTSVSCKSLTLGAGAVNATLTINSFDNLSVLGNITIGLLGTLVHKASTITLTGNWSNQGSYRPQFTSSTVTFAGTAQTIDENTAFATLRISAGSTTTLNKGFNIYKTLSVSGTLDPQLHQVTVADSTVTIVVNNYGLIKVRAATLRENYNSAVQVAPLSTIEYASEAIDQTIVAGPYGTLKISGNTVKTLAGNSVLQSSGSNVGNIIVASGTLNLADKTINRGISTAGGELLVVNGASLRIGGIQTMPANYATYSLGNSSTVVYDGVNQTIALHAYGHLGLSAATGTATKIFPAQPLIIYGNFTSTKGSGLDVNYAAGANMTIYGNVSIGASTTFNAGNFTHTVGGNWQNDGSLVGAGSTIQMDGTGKLITGVGSLNFNNLIINGSGIGADALVITVAGNFATTQAGSFTHRGTGTCIMSGSGKTISGTEIVFQNLSIPGSISTTTSFTIESDLSVEGAFTAGAGTITMTGTAKSISSTGSLAFSSLNARGGISTVSSFAVKDNLLVQGSLTATAGTVSFTGNSSVSGNPNLYHVQVTGTLLKLNSGSVLGVAGIFGTGAASFDAQSAVPNTVDYNGNNPQEIAALNYYHLAVSAAGTKTAAANFTTQGDLTINSGAILNAGTAAPTIYGNWINLGSFQASSSNIQFAGSTNGKIYGNNTFNSLTINKGEIQHITLESATTAATVAMLSGRLLTGSQQITITGTRTGNGIILGTIARTHAFTTGVAYAFESPFNTLTFSSLANVSTVTVKVEDQPVSDFPTGGAINRQYDVFIGTGSYDATLRLHYELYNLNGNIESSLELWKHTGTNWIVSGKTANDTTDNWVEQAGITSLNARWTMSEGLKPFVWKGVVSNAWENFENWLVPVGSASLLPTAGDIVEIGLESFSNQPVIASNVAVKSISLGSVRAVDLSLNSGSLTTAGNLTSLWTGDAIHTFSVGINKLTIGGDLVLGNGVANQHINLNAGGGIVTIQGSLQQSGNASLILSGETILNLEKNFIYNGGVFDAGSGTVRYTGSNNQVIAGLNYHHLTIAKPSGTAVLDAEAHIRGNFTLENGGDVKLNAQTFIAGNVLIGIGTTLNSGNVTLDVKGNWTRNGTFNANTGTVRLTGLLDQRINNQTFNNLNINKASAKAILEGNIIVNGDLNVAAGAIDVQSYALNRSSPGGSLVIGPGASMLVGGADNFPKNFATHTLDSTSLVHYNAVLSQQLAPTSYGHLQLSNGTTNAKFLSGPTQIRGDLIVSSTATMNAQAHTVTLYGHCIKEGDLIPATGTMIFAGINKTIKGSAYTFNHMNVTGSYTIAEGINVDVDAYTLSGYNNTGANIINIHGDVHISGSYVADGINNFMGNKLQLIRLDGSISSPNLLSTYNFNGTVAPVLNSATSVAQFVFVNINNTAAIKASTNWHVIKGIGIATGSTFDGGGFTHNFRGSFTNNGTIRSSGALNFLPLNFQTTSVPVKLGSGEAFKSYGNVLFGGSRKIDLTGTPAQLNHVSIQNTHAEGIILPGSWILSGDLSIGTGATLHAGAYAHQIGGNINNQGAFNGQTSAVTMGSGLSNISGNGSTLFHHLIVADSVVAQQNISLTGNLTVNNVFDANSVEVTFTGSGNSEISGSYSPVQMKVLIADKLINSATTSLSVDIHNLSRAEVKGGILDLKHFFLYKDTVHPTTQLSVKDGASLRIGGTNTLPLFNEYLLDSASTVAYTGTEQPIYAANYGNLQISNAGKKTFNGGETFIRGNFIISDSATANAILNKPLVHYSGNRQQLVRAIAYHDLQLGGGGIKTFEAGTTTIAGALGISAAVVPDALTNSTSLEFNGSGLQTIPAMDYYNLRSSVGTNRTLANAGIIRIKSSFDPGTSVYTTTGSSVEFNGNVQQTIPALSYHNLIINNAGGGTIPADVAIEGQLTLNKGNLLTGDNKVTLAPAASLSNEDNGHYVVGHVKITQQVGTNAATFGNIGLALDAGVDDLGAVTVLRTTGAAITKNGESGIKRIWDITAGGSQPASGRKLTFSWLGDDDNGNNLTNLQVWRSKDLVNNNWERIGPLQAATITNITHRHVSVTTDHFSLWTLRSDDLFPLPVDMLFFTGSRNSRNEAELRWATAREVNNQGFTIERSADGTMFTSIGFVAGNGTTSQQQHFSFTDYAPSDDAYYRLKQTDYDGATEYSKVIYLPNRYEAPLIVYPNPAREHVTITGSTALQNNAGTLQAKLVNLQGVEVLRTNGTLASINQAMNNCLPKLSVGIYYLSIVNGNNTSNVKLVIQ